MKQKQKKLKYLSSSSEDRSKPPALNVSARGHTNTATVTVLHKNIYKSTSYLQYTDATVWRKTQVPTILD